MRRRTEKTRNSSLRRQRQRLREAGGIVFDPSRNTTRPSLIHHHDVVMVSGLGRFGNTSPRCHPSFDRCFAVPVDPRGALIASLDTLADVVSRAVSEIP